VGHGSSSDASASAMSTVQDLATMVDVHLTVNGPHERQFDTVLPRLPA
jgi:hypothetical protein